MGGIHFTMTEEELLMVRERKVEESYKNYYDSRPELKKASDEYFMCDGKFFIFDWSRNYGDWK